MITSKQIINISEEWLKSVKVGSGLVNVYEDPTSSDYAQIYKDSKRRLVRFIASNIDKKVYVWDGYLAIHNEIIGKIGLRNFSDFNDSNFITGEANIEGGALRIIRLYVYEFPGEAEEWKWADKYIKGFSQKLQKDRGKEY